MASTDEGWLVGGDLMDLGGDAPACPAAVDARTGQTYYVNAATGETSWSVPRALPHGWVAHTSDASGATYYHNASTGATSWEKPTE